MVVETNLEIGLEPMGPFVASKKFVKKSWHTVGAGYNEDE